MKPDHLKLLKKAHALDRSGNATEASRAYKQFLGREPKHANTWADYAGQLLKLDQLEAAQKACETALEIDPHQAPARINLGVILMRRNQFDKATEQFQSVLVMDSHRIDAQLFLAECLLNKRDLDNARKILDSVNRPGALDGAYSAFKHHCAELNAIFSSALFEVQKFTEAEEACCASLKIDPNNFTARANLGSIRMAQGFLEQAKDLFRRLVNDFPQEECAPLLLITCLTRMGDLACADEEIAKIVEREPHNLTVHNSVIGVNYNCGRWPQYKAEIERFRQADPTSAHPEWEQSLVDLLFGDMPQGWKRYEARLRLPVETKPQRHFSEPTWDGTPFAGKTLLLWAEQGFGDTLMFLRYLPLVKALGGHIILEVQPALVDLAATCPGADRVLPKGAPLPPFDLQSSLMSLPWAFRTELSTIPAEIPYLDVPTEIPNREAILNCLAQTKGSTRIGLVWAGRPGYSRDFERSLPATALAPLAALQGVAWFSFQVGRREVPPLLSLISLAPTFKNFSDTAYALSGMDLVITVDTAVAHLAGALGIPTFLLLPFQPDFRWLLLRDDSPWYPSLRLYRQPAYGDWESVIEQVFTDLSLDS